MSKTFTVIEEDGTETELSMGGYALSYYDDSKGARWVTFTSKYSHKTHRFKWTEGISFVYPEIN